MHKCLTPAQRKVHLRAARSRYYRKKKKDPSWVEQNRRIAREGMQRLSQRRALSGKRGGVPQLAPGYAIVSATRVDHPPLYYIDAGGHIRQEDARSAEAVIRDWERQQRRNHK